MQSRDYWDEVYRSKPSTSVSWYQPSPEPTLKALDRLSIARTASLVDVGGGASNLVDRLIERGWPDLTVLDIAAPALEVARERLGPLAASVHWEVADITTWRPRRRFDVWHDRAVFHFLTDPDQREAYRSAMLAGTATGSIVIMATFALDGPEKCSGLPVARYDPATLAAELGPAFRPLSDWREDHVTPGGGRQTFNWCVFRRAS